LSIWGGCNQISGNKAKFINIPRGRLPPLGFSKGDAKWGIYIKMKKYAEKMHKTHLPVKKRRLRRVNIPRSLFIFV